MLKKYQMVCHECIGNKIIKKFIKENGERVQCSYCGHRRLSVQIEFLEPLMLSAIEFEFDRAVDELPWDEGAYVGETYTNYDVLEELSADIDAADEDILVDIGNMLEDEVWCDKNGFRGREEENAIYNWKSFCQEVKWKSRFVFFRMEAEELQYRNAGNILDEIAYYVQQAHLTRELNYKTNLYRCRTHDERICFTAIEDFAPPPKEKACSGRMNAAGISIFYLTLDSKTALLETLSPERPCASVATFRIKEPLCVLDLTKIYDMDLPSVFDEKNRESRCAILFLRDFVKTISQSRNNQDIDVDYIPTQIVTEFFRHVASYNGKPYNGIMYRSAKDPEGISLALFLTREEVLSKKYGIHMLLKRTERYRIGYDARFERLF